MIWLNFLFKKIFFLFCLFRSIPTAYGSSQSRGQFGATAANLHHSHSNAGSEPHLWPTPQLMAMPKSLTHWVRPGIESSTSWFPVRFVSAAPQRELFFFFSPDLIFKSIMVAARKMDWREEARNQLGSDSRNPDARCWWLQQVVVEMISGQILDVFWR